MSKINGHVGDCLSVRKGFIIHGCNALGIMGGGFALAVRNRYPGAYLAYREAYTNKGLELGQIIPYEVPAQLVPAPETQDLFAESGCGCVEKGEPDPDCPTHGMTASSNSKLYIINAITQLKVGTERRQVDYPGLKVCFEHTARLAREKGVTDIHFPRIGCGLAGGDWKVVAAIIKETLEGLSAHLWVPKTEVNPFKDSL